jgi:hypothetical protein
VTGWPPCANSRRARVYVIAGAAAGPAAEPRTSREASMFSPNLDQLALDAEQALRRQRERTAARDPELAWSRGHALPDPGAAAEPWLRRLRRRAHAAFRWRPGRTGGVVADAPAGVE